MQRSFVLRKHVMRNKTELQCVVLALIIVACLLIAPWLASRIVPLPLYEDPKPSHEVTIWVVKTGFIYSIGIRWYESKSDAENEVDGGSGWSTVVESGTDLLCRTGHFYRLPESTVSVWTRLTYHRMTNERDVLETVSIVYQFEIGVKENVTIAGFGFAFLIEEL
jgi:hypothetical protein